MDAVEITLENPTEKHQIFAVHVSIVASAAIFLLSLTIGIISDSIALILDASAGLITLITAFFMRVIVTKVNQPPDETFNFGYAKYEPLTVAIQGVAIILSCVIAAKFAIQDIIHAEDIVRYDLPAISAFVATCIAITVAIYLKRVYKKTKSSMFKMASLNWFVDAFLSAGMFFGFLFGYATLRLGYIHITPYVDPVLALILAIFLIRSPLEAITHNMLELLDAVPPKEIREAVEKIVSRHKNNFSGTKRMRLRKAGQKLFLNICFLVSDEFKMGEAQELIINLENELIKEFPGADLTVSLEVKKRGQAEF